MNTLFLSPLCRHSHHQKLGIFLRLNTCFPNVQQKNSIKRSYLKSITCNQAHCLCTVLTVKHTFIRKYYTRRLAASHTVHRFPQLCTRTCSSTVAGGSGRNERTVEEVATPKVREILRGVFNGERAKLAEAITLVESKHPIKHRQAQWLLTSILSRKNKQLKQGILKPTYRIGLSGPPGAGKSTFIEAFGLILTELGYKIGVLAVDPSSTRTGGSILGDKTRMPRLTREPNAYIRPSPSGGTLGGVTRNTNEAIMLCEGAGFDVVLVETVGVGQSETAVCDMVDMFVLIIPPAAGDELQGLKKGIVELCDLILVNKADGDLLPAARRIQAEYVSALKLIQSKHRGWNVQVMRVSSLYGDNIAKSWEVMQNFFSKMMDCGEFDAKRKKQQRLWLWNHIDWELRKRFRSHPGMIDSISYMEERVMAGTMAPGTAADMLLDRFINLYK